jgi:PAB1-binding protein PBP1
VEVLLRSGTIYEGLLESITDANNLNLVHVRKVPRDGKVATHMNILASDFISIKVKEFAPSRGGKWRRYSNDFTFLRIFANCLAVFQTDTVISKSSGSVKERELQKWVPDGDEFSQSLDGKVNFLF